MPLDSLTLPPPRTAPTPQPGNNHPSATSSAPTLSRTTEVLQTRFLRAGAGALRSHELLALLLRGTHSASRASAIAQALLATFPSIAHVLAASREQLETLPGIDNDAICSIKLAESLGIVLATAHLPDDIDPELNNYDKVIDYCRTRLGFKPIEEMHTLFLNNRNRLIRAELSQVGTVNHTPAYPREIVHRALQLHASAIIVVHNHPSTDPTPSRADIEITKKLADAAQLFDIRLQDHIIITPSRATSFRAKGLI